MYINRPIYTFELSVCISTTIGIPNKMSEKYHLPAYGETTTNPPPYTPTAPFVQQQQQPVVIVDMKSGLFHKGARFNTFSKPYIPPPPPGCPPNQFQIMQMERGPLEVVITDSPRHCFT